MSRSTVRPVSARVHIADARDGIHLTVEDAGEGFDMTRTREQGWTRLCQHAGALTHPSRDHFASSPLPARGTKN